MTTVNANVVLATAGRSVSEIMGNGSAATPNQSFTLKQSPLTYIQAPTPTGRQSTLQVRPTESPGPKSPRSTSKARPRTVFATLNQSDGTTDVLFGDGVEGAHPAHRPEQYPGQLPRWFGIGRQCRRRHHHHARRPPAWRQRRHQSRAATGGQDPQSVDDVRANAPLSVLTLGRAVSITDYQNYAATFAGIAKAYAIWIPSGPSRGVFLTVAGAGGAALPPGNPTLANLVTSLQNYGNPLIPIIAVILPRDALRLLGRPRLRPRLRPTGGAGADHADPAQPTASPRAPSARASPPTRSPRSSRPSPASSRSTSQLSPS